MNKYSTHANRGLSRFLFGNSRTGALVLLVLLYFLNLALILLIDNTLIHSVPEADMTPEALGDHIHGQVLSLRQDSGDYILLYRTPDGSRKVLAARANLLSRYSLIPLGAKTIPQGQDSYTYDGPILDFTVAGDTLTSASILGYSSLKTQAGILIALAMVLTMAQRLLIEKLRGQ